MGLHLQDLSDMAFKHLPQWDVAPMSETKFREMFMEVEKVLRKHLSEEVKLQVHGVARQLMEDELKHAIWSEVRKLVRERIEVQAVMRVKE